MELASCHPSGAHNFEVGKLCTLAFKVFSLGLHTERPAIAPHFETFREVHFFFVNLASASGDLALNISAI